MCLHAGGKVPLLQSSIHFTERVSYSQHLTNTLNTPDKDLLLPLDYGHSKYTTVFDNSIYKGKGSMGRTPLS